MLLYDKMPPFEGVAAGQTALIKMPIGRRFHFVDLVYSGVTLSQMTEIRVILNNKVTQRFSATERDIMNQYYGLEAAAGILRIPFNRLGLKLRDLEEQTAINTDSVDPEGRRIAAFSIEVDISANADSPALEAYAEMSPQLPGGPGVVMHIRKTSRSIAGAGDLEVSDLMYGTPISQALNALFMKPSAGSISQVEVWRDTYREFRRTTAQNEKIQKEGGRVPQSGYWVIDSTERGYGANQIALVKRVGDRLEKLSDFRVIPTLSGAATVNFIAEYMGVLGD